MKTSDKGINLIKQFEGLRLKAYKCPAGIWTIGYGHTGGIVKGIEITEKLANDFLLNDLVFFENIVNKYVKVQITQNQFDALVSFVFNIGPNAFKESTLLKYVNMQAFSQVPEQFMRWVKGGKGEIIQGLVNRRQKEVMLWKGEI